VEPTVIGQPVEECGIDLAGRRRRRADHHLVIGDRDVDARQRASDRAELGFAPLARIGRRPPHHLATEFGLAVGVEHDHAELVAEAAGLHWGQWSGDRPHDLQRG
jgi:hypothetical protein